MDRGARFNQAVGRLYLPCLKNRFDSTFQQTKRLWESRLFLSQPTSNRCTLLGDLIEPFGPRLPCKSI